MSDHSAPPPDVFDQATADRYVGKYILVGVTYFDAQGKELRRAQYHGEIQSVSPNGIVIALRGAHEGQTWNMPPDLRAISTAGPGRYTLHTTGEVVEDPDLLAKWRIDEPQKH